MIEIITLVGIIVVILMAKKGRGKRKFQRYLKGAISHRLVTTTLASRVVVGSAVGDTVNERTFVSSIVALWNLDNVTLGSGIGPMMVGVAHSDYSDAEIEAWIENTGSWDEGDLVQQEIAKRKIRRVGVFESADGPTESISLNDGKNVRTKCGWVLLQGQTLKVWAYNTGTNPYATTAPNVRVEGYANLWPR